MRAEFYKRRSELDDLKEFTVYSLFPIYCGTDPMHPIGWHSQLSSFPWHRSAFWATVRRGPEVVAAGWAEAKLLPPVLFDGFTSRHSIADARAYARHGTTCTRQ